MKAFSSKTRGRSALEVTPQLPASNLDTSFDPGSGPDDAVECLAIEADGSVLIGGPFANVNGVRRMHLARLSREGDLDAGFQPTLKGKHHFGLPNCFVVQPDGKILIGGSFTTVNGVDRNGLARLNPNGSVDTGFLSGMTGPDGAVYAAVLQPDGRVIIAGGFHSVNGVEREGLARLNRDGSLDRAFVDGMDGAVQGVPRCVALQPDGRIVVGGHFINVFGAVINLFRLKPDGTLDRTFLDRRPGPNAEVDAILLQPDGSIIIGGRFLLVNGLPAEKLARLHSDGSLDNSFMSAIGSGDILCCLQLQPDGRIIAGGRFHIFDRESGSALYRLRSDGLFDGTLAPAFTANGCNLWVFCLGFQTDGRIIVGGNFRTIDGCLRRNLAMLFPEKSERDHLPSPSSRLRF